MSIEINTTLEGSGLNVPNAAHAVMGFYLDETTNLMQAVVYIYKDEATATSDPSKYIMKKGFNLSEDDKVSVQPQIDALKDALESILANVDPAAEKTKEAEKEAYDKGKARWPWNYKQNGTKK